MKYLCVLLLSLCACGTLETRRTMRPYRTRAIHGNPKTIQREFVNGREVGEWRPRKSFDIRGNTIVIWDYYPRQ